MITTTNPSAGAGEAQFADDGAVEGELDPGADDGHVDLGSLVGVPDPVVGAGEAHRAGAVHQATHRCADGGGPWRSGLADG
jgi:hypothetical protein